jgi:hypothetical protein
LDPRRVPACRERHISSKLSPGLTVQGRVIVAETNFDEAELQAFMEKSFQTATWTG